MGGRRELNLLCADRQGHQTWHGQHDDETGVPGSQAERCVHECPPAAVDAFAPAVLGSSVLSFSRFQAPAIERTAFGADELLDDSRAAQMFVDRTRMIQYRAPLPPPWCMTALIRSMGQLEGPQRP